MTQIHLNSNLRSLLLCAQFLLVGCAESVDDESRRLLENAKKGGAVAQFNFAVFLSNGEKKVKNYPEAVLWFRKSADQGFIEAAYNLGVIYKTGEVGVEKGDACRWFKKAAEGQHALAMYEFALCEQGELKIKWLGRAVEKGIGDAATQIGIEYLYGRDGVLQDKETGVRWILKGAQMGSGIGMYNLATLFAQGIVLDKNLKNAFDWYRKSADIGFCSAFFQVGQYHEFGVVVNQNSNKALQYYQKGAEHGDKKALDRMVLVYENGELNMTQDHGKAIQVSKIRASCQM